MGWWCGSGGGAGGLMRAFLIGCGIIRNFRIAVPAMRRIDYLFPVVSLKSAFGGPGGCHGRRSPRAHAVQPGLEAPAPPATVPAFPALRRRLALGGGAGRRAVARL